MNSTYNRIITKGIEIILKREGLDPFDLYDKVFPEFQKLGVHEMDMVAKIKGIIKDLSPEEIAIISRVLNTDSVKIFFVGLAALRGEDREKKARDLIDIALGLASRLAIYQDEIPAFEQLSLKELGEEYTDEELEIVRELAVKLAQTEAIKKLQNI